MSVDYDIRECAAILCDTYFQDPLRLCFRKMLMI